MSKTLVFEGYSDDTFYCRGPGIDVDHDNSASGKPIRMVVKSGADCIFVTGQYCPFDATGWQISVAPGADDPDETPFPSWPMSLTPSERPYSPRLTIEAPDDVFVELYQRRKQ